MVRAGYKQTEVGVIPEDWEVKSGLEVFIKIQDGTHFSPKISNGNYLYLTSKNIKDGYLNLKDICFIDKKQHDLIYKRCNVKYGDILLTKDGANTGNVALNTIKDEFSLLSSIAFLRVSDNNHNKFYLQQILSEAFQKQVQDAMSGNAITRLTLTKIKLLKFYCPSLKEQTAIATALSDIDALITTLTELIDKKRQIKTATMQQLLTGKQRLAGFGEGKGIKSTELGEIPEDWEIKKLGDVCLTYSGGTPNTSNKSYYGGDIFWITSGDLNISPIREVTGRISEKGLNSSSAKMVRPKTLLFALYGATAGVVAITNIKAAINQAVLAIKAQKINNEFLYYFLDFRKDYLIKTYTQGGQPNFSADIVKQFQVLLPLLKEQQAIAQVLSDMDDDLNALETRLTKTKAIKQGMMQELLTGRTRLI